MALHCVRRREAASWLLASGADISAMDSLGETPLHKASWTGNLDLKCLYLDAGSPVDQRNHKGWIRLMQSHFASISKVLLDHSAGIHASTDQGFATIHLAVGSCNLELVSLLLANTADV
jgi:ankyrin repeat protein